MSSLDLLDFGTESSNHVTSTMNNTTSSQFTENSLNTIANSSTNSSMSLSTNSINNSTQQSSTSSIHGIQAKYIKKPNCSGAFGIDSIYILDAKGKPLISRQYRPIGDISHLSIINQFTKKIILQSDENISPPIVYLDLSTIHTVASCTIAYMKHENIYCKYSKE